MLKADETTHRISDPGNFGKRMLAVGIAGMAIAAAGWIVNPAQFFHSYLVALAFWVSIAAGALFFTMLHHLVGAKWSIVLRRIAETVMTNLGWLALLALPLLFGLSHLYHWSHAETVAADPILKGKAAFLNVPFFVIRMVFYFGIWFWLTRSLYGVSLAQDRGFHPEQVRKMRRLSAPGMILFALTVTFAAFDWLMSLDAHWYSTIFGVYYFSGALVGVIGFLIVTIYMLNRSGVMTKVVSEEHYHDLGKLLFAFTIFWAYIAFSQYFLIWYANIPEETIWFRHRWEGSWKVISLVLVFGHFVVPFLILITRGAKRKKGFLALMAGWMLLMHGVDLYWIVMPGLHQHGFHISWMDPAALVGVGGIFLWLFWRRLVRQPLLPAGDPGLSESINLTSG